MAVLYYQFDFYGGMVMKNKNINEKVGDKIRFVRRVNNMKTKDLAKILDVSQQQMSRYERGVNRIDVSIIYKISQYFNYPLGFFFEGIYLESEADSLEKEPDILNSIYIPSCYSDENYH